MTILGPSAVNQVINGGSSLVAIYGPTLGGFITNPLTAADQGIIPFGVPYVNPEPLFVSFIGPASLQAGGNTHEVMPGQTLIVPPSIESVWVNAPTSGHYFSAVVYLTAPPPPTPNLSAFPPEGPVGMTKVIPSYLYKQFEDDDDLRAFVNSQNSAQQDYVDWFNSLDLPIYTKQSGALLDWVGTGLYGLPRATLYSNQSVVVGPFNTYTLDGFGFNDQETVGADNVTVTTDDVYKRILTWHLFRGDGHQFSVPWLKRRIYRFLYGANGSDASGDMSQISVTFGPEGELAITLVTGRRDINGGAFFDDFGLNDFNGVFDNILSTMTTFSIPDMALTFQEAMNSGALEMPFQYDVTVNIGA